MSSLFDINTGMIHMDLNPVTLEGSFDENGKSIRTVKFRQNNRGPEPTYVNDAPCVSCPERSGCMTECLKFEEYVDPIAYKRKMEKYG